MATKREFFSTNEVAQTLGISPFTIRRYIRLRKLKAVKLEGSYRVRHADLERFLKAREIETEEELAALDEAEAEAPAKSAGRKTTAGTSTRVALKANPEPSRAATKKPRSPAAVKRSQKKAAARNQVKT